MAQPLTTANTSIELPSTERAPDWKTRSVTSLKGLAQRLGKLFWAYTEDAGESDTSSYKGLL